MQKMQRAHFLEADRKWGRLQRNLSFLILQLAVFGAIADALLWGCLLAFYKNSVRKFTVHPACGALITSSTIALLIALSISHIQHITVFLHLLPALLLASILFSEKNPVNALLQMSPLRFIGRLSYSVYIWQQLLLGGPGAKVNIYLSLLLIAALSFLSYTLIELPC